MEFTLRSFAIYPVISHWVFGSGIGEVYPVPICLVSAFPIVWGFMGPQGFKVYLQTSNLPLLSDTFLPPTGVVSALPSHLFLSPGREINLSIPITAHAAGVIYSWLPTA